MATLAHSRICPWCLGARTCRTCDGNGDALFATDEDEVIEVRSKCAVCCGTGECVNCQGTGQVATKATQDVHGDPPAPGSTIHKLLRLRPGSAPDCLCSRQRWGGGSLIDLLTASILLLPLVTLPIFVPATNWSWLLLLCVPVAYLVSVYRRQFEQHEWLARDVEIARAYSAAGPRVETVDQDVVAPDDCQVNHRGIRARKLFAGDGHSTWIAQVVRGSHSQTLRAISVAEITERIDEALEDWPRPGEAT